MQSLQFGESVANDLDILKGTEVRFRQMIKIAGFVLDFHAQGLAVGSYGQAQKPPHKSFSQQ